MTPEKKSQKILIVDDQTENIDLLMTVLRDQYKIVAARNGEKALALASTENPPDLILLDVMMPKKTGFVLFGQLRKDERFKDIPIIMLTGVAEVLEGLDAESDATEESPYDPLREAMRKRIRQMKDEGLVKPDMFIDKPIDPELVMAKVKELIGS